MKLIQDLGMKFPNKNSKTKRHYGLYECPKCFNEIRTQIIHVKTGASKQCITCARTLHGEAKTRLYQIWSDMKQRCSNNKLKNYNDYGGRGIIVDSTWEIYIIFKDWALTNGYEDNLTIDRINPNGNYEPTNCRWTNKTIQSQNTKLIRKTNTTGYRGVSMTRNKKRFTSQIRNNGKIYLGTFNTAVEAAKTYDNYIIKHKLEQPRNFND